MTFLKVLLMGRSIDFIHLQHISNVIYFITIMFYYFSGLGLLDWPIITFQILLISISDLSPWKPHICSEMATDKHLK